MLETVDEVPAVDRDRRGAAPSRPTSLVMLIAGTAGLLASLWLAIEKFRVLANPGYLPSCSLSRVVDCGSVMQSWQSSLLGFPNALIGVAAYPVVITVAVLTLAGSAPRRWIWAGLVICATAGTLFVHWLAWQTAYDIRAVCLYCMVVWASTLTILGCAVSAALSGAGRDMGESAPPANEATRWIPVGVLVWAALLAITVAWGLGAS